MAEIFYKDETRFPDGSRIICPANRKGGVIFEDRFPDRPTYKFSVRHGDLSLEESKQYAGRIQQAPNRSMFVLEGAKRSNGALLEFGGNINWQARAKDDTPVAPLLDPHPNSFHVLAQYNSHPTDGKWKSPPFGIDAKNIGGVEHIVANLNITVDGVTKGFEIGKAPMERRKHDVLVQFRNMAGKIGGMARVMFDGKVIADYEGVTGHENHNWSFHAFGLYRWAWSPPQNTVDAWFENWQERIVI